MAGNYRDGFVPSGGGFVLKSAKPDAPIILAEEIDWLAAQDAERRRPVTWFELLLFDIAISVAIYLDDMIWLFAVVVPFMAWSLWRQVDTYAEARSMDRWRRRGWEIADQSALKNSLALDVLLAVLWTTMASLNFAIPSIVPGPRWVFVVVAVQMLWSLGKRLYSMWRERQARA